jgi:hypothetical protein
VLPEDREKLLNLPHAYYVGCGQQDGQNSLKSRMEQSHQTIHFHLCRSVARDLRGSEPLFDPQNVE